MLHRGLTVNINYNQLGLLHGYYQNSGNSRSQGYKVGKKVCRHKQLAPKLQVTRTAAVTFTKAF